RFEVSKEDADDCAYFVARLEAPPAGPLDPQGAALFTSTGCAVCHRLDRRGTDLCAHDLGLAMASDDATNGATITEWRTAPLMGIRFRTHLIHDGRAGASVLKAIEAHGGAGAAVRAQFLALPLSDQQLVITYVSNL